MIPKSVENATPVICKPATCNVKPPIPDTKITLAMKRFFLLSKSILFSTKILIPLEAITQNRAI